MQKQPFPVRGGKKKFEDWGGLKNFRIGRRGTFAGVGRGQYPHYMP